MLVSVLLIILSTGTSLAEGVVIKKYNNRYDRGGFIFTALVALFSMLFFFITDRNGICFQSGIVHYGIISGIMYGCASIFTYMALECGSFAMTMLVLSYSILFQIVYGVCFLHESADITKYIGFSLLMISIYLMNGKGKEDKIRVSLKWVVAMVISFICSGMFAVIQRIQQIEYDDAYTNEFMIVTLLFAGISLLIIGIINDRKDLGYIVKHGSIFAAGAGLSNGATNFLGLVVNTMIPFSIAGCMRSGIKIIISFAVSVLMFKEKFERQQLIGLIIGTLALIFLNI